MASDLKSVVIVGKQQGVDGAQRYIQTKIVDQAVRDDQAAVDVQIAWGQDDNNNHEPWMDEYTIPTPKVAASSQQTKMSSIDGTGAWGTPALSSATDKFNFKREAPVSVSENPEWWACKALKLDGVNKNRYHLKTGLVLELTETKLVGTFINNKAIFLQDVSEDVKEWCRKSGITVEEEDIELDEELESEDEE